MNDFGPDARVLRVNGLDARDAAAQIRATSELLANRGDLANALLLAIQAAITVASQEAIAEVRPLLLRLQQERKLAILPQVVTSAYLAAALSVVNNFAPLTEREIGILDDMRTMANQVFDLFIDRIRSEGKP